MSNDQVAHAMVIVDGVDLSEYASRLTIRVASGPGTDQFVAAARAASTLVSCKEASGQATIVLRTALRGHRRQTWARRRWVAVEWDALKDDEFCGIDDERDDSERIREVARRLQALRAKLRPERYGSPAECEKQDFDLVKKDLQKLGKLAG